MLQINFLWNCSQSQTKPHKTFDVKSTLDQVMAWCSQATSLCLSPCRPRSRPPYGVIRPQWVKTKKRVSCSEHHWIWGPIKFLSACIWIHRTRSTLALIMACCLMAPSHHLPSVMSSEIHLRPISQDMLQLSITKVSLKMTYPNFIHISQGTMS